MDRCCVSTQGADPVRGAEGRAEERQVEGDAGLTFSAKNVQAQETHQKNEKMAAFCCFFGWLFDETSTRLDDFFMKHPED